MTQEKSLTDEAVVNKITYDSTFLQRLLKAIEVAEILNVSKSMAYRLMQTREIPTVNIGNAKRVRPIDLRNYINSKLTEANS